MCGRSLQAVGISLAPRVRKNIVEQNPLVAMLDDRFIDAGKFPRPNRLTHAVEYDGVFKHASRSADLYFTVLYCRNNLGHPRLGLAIAKKRIRRAVARNRLKRIIRDSFRHAKKQLLGVDIVIMARDQSEQAVNQDLFASLEKHWRAVARSNRS